MEQNDFFPVFGVPLMVRCEHRHHLTFTVTSPSYLKLQLPLCGCGGTESKSWSMSVARCMCSAAVLKWGGHNLTVHVHGLQPEPCVVDHLTTSESRAGLCKCICKKSQTFSFSKTARKQDAAVTCPSGRARVTHTVLEWLLIAGFPFFPVAVEKVYIRSVPYESLRKSTNDFSDRYLSEGGYKVGQGGFGDVFYVKISVKGRPKLECAVKRLVGDYSHPEMKKQFEAEVETMKAWVSLICIVVCLH